MADLEGKVSPMNQAPQQSYNKQHAAQQRSYLNAASQKAKLILPTALWILMVVAGLSFLVLLASISGHLRTLVRLEDDRNIIQYIQLKNERQLLEDNQQEDKHYFNHHHNHRNHDQKMKHKSTSTSALEEPTVDRDQKEMSDLMFSDQDLSPSGWFSSPSWSSLGQAKHRDGELAPQEELVVSIEAGSDAQPEEIGSMFDSVMKKFLSGHQNTFGRGPTDNIFTRKNGHSNPASIERFNINLAPENEFKSHNHQHHHHLGHYEPERHLPLDELIGKLVGSPSSMAILPEARPSHGPISPLASLLALPKQPRAEPYEQTAPVLFTNGLNLFGQEHEKLHNQQQAAKDQQWQSLSSDLGQSILQSLLPGAGSSGDINSVSADLSSSNNNNNNQPETLVMIDGKPLNPSESKKFLSKMFEGPSESAKQDETSSVGPVGELFQQMLGHSTRPQDPSKGDDMRETPIMSTTIIPPSVSTGSISLAPQSAEPTIESSLEPATVIGDMLSMFTLPQYGSGTASTGNYPTEDGANNKSSPDSRSNGGGKPPSETETTIPVTTSTASSSSSLLETTTTSTSTTTTTNRPSSTEHERATLDPLFKNFMELKEGEELVLDKSVVFKTSEATTTKAPVAEILQTSSTNAPTTTTSPPQTTTKPGLDGFVVLKDRLTSSDESQAIDLSPFAKVDLATHDKLYQTTTTPTPATTKQAGTLKPKEKQVSSFLQKADEFLGKSLKSLKQMF